MDSMTKKRARSSDTQTTHLTGSSYIAGQLGVEVPDGREEEEEEEEPQAEAERGVSNDSFERQDIHSGKVQRPDRMKCPYLDTISRSVLDFDSEKLCSVTMSNMNIYSCLVCGKFFQGRGKQTPAYVSNIWIRYTTYLHPVSSVSKKYAQI